MKNKKIVLNNSFTEFLFYTTPNGKVKVEIFLRNENVWLTQAKIAELFGVDQQSINTSKTSLKAGNCRKIQLFPKWK